MVVPLKDKKGITITNAVQTILDMFNHKPNKIWVDKCCEFYYRSMKLWLQDNDIEFFQPIIKKHLLFLKEIQIYDFNFKKCIY